MEHKAFPFDWRGFDSDLRPILQGALETGATGPLERYIHANRAHLTDPYEGEPLSDDWRDMLENGDVHELGDYALTRFYNPLDDGGLSDAWLELSDCLPEPAQAALLGKPLGTSGNLFDPGRMGSYFQTPAEIAVSLAELEGHDTPALAEFRELLRTCARKGLGLYVTF